MLQNVDCYEERHRLTGRIAGSLAFSLVFLALGIFFPLSLPERAVYLTYGGVIALRGVVVLVSHVIAFRADRAGITLGADVFNLPFRFCAVFISWADIERIVLSTGDCGDGFAGSSASESSATRRPRPSPAATSRLPAARCLAYQLGQLG